MSHLAKKAFARLQNLSLIIASHSRQLEWKLRCTLLNKQPGVYVSSKAFIAKTIKFQMSYGKEFVGGKIHISDNAIISDGVILSPYGGSISIGENVFLGPYCVVSGHGGLTISRDSMIAACSIIIPSSHGFSSRDVPIRLQASTDLGISIGEDVWIGCGVKVLDGVSVGKGCVIGAGAVVNRSIPEYSIVVGVPAKIIGARGTVDSFCNSLNAS